MANRISITTEPGRALQEALSVLADGHVIAMPTETVYGLAGDATNPAGITAIYETKGRPRFNPLICHMADLTMARRYAEFDPLSLKLAETFWPGPLTLVLPLKPESGIHALATAGLDTVGIRVPQGFASRLIEAFNRPIAAPSANSSGRISPTSADHVEADLGSKIALILDGGASPVGVESTIVKIEGDRVRLLRPGGIAAEEIEAILGHTIERSGETRAIIEAPGMLASHYAPDAALRIDARSVEPGEALINFADQAIEGRETAHAIFDLSASGDLPEAAANLFDMMKRADASGAGRIAVAPIPDHGLGEAINDRLARAAAPRDAAS